MCGERKCVLRILGALTTLRVLEYKILYGEFEVDNFEG